MARRSSKGENTTPKASGQDSDGNVWEDTLILALREMQWQKWVDRWHEPLRASSRNRVRQTELLDIVRAGPPLLVKFSGNAETAAGDVLTAQDERFFVFEFKSGKNQIGTEEDKRIFAAFQMIVLDKETHAEIEDLSRRGHYGVYATSTADSNKFTKTVVIENALQAVGANGSLGVNLTIEAEPYLDWIETLVSSAGEKAARKVAGQRNFEKVKQAAESDTPPGDAEPCDRTLEHLMWGSGNSPKGLSLQDMTTYLEALAKITPSGTNGSGLRPARVKVAVVGTGGTCLLSTTLEGLGEHMAPLFHHAVLEEKKRVEASNAAGAMAQKLGDPAKRLEAHKKRKYLNKATQAFNDFVELVSRTTEDTAAWKAAADQAFQEMMKPVDDIEVHSTDKKASVKKSRP